MTTQIVIKKEKPPQWIWDKAHEMFVIDDDNILFTYGNIIFDPGNHSSKLSKSVIAHEETHTKQQALLRSPDEWWEKYFSDVEFRKSQELEAYANQYKHFCTTEKNRDIRAKYLTILAQFASSPLYKLDLEFREALSAIRTGK